MSDSPNSKPQQVSDDPGADDEISLLDIAQVIAENLRFLILTPLLVGLAALGISYLITPTFSAKTQILPPQQQQGAAASLLQGLGALGGLASAATGLKNPNDQFVAMLKSRTVADGLIEQFKLIARYESETLFDARKTLESRSTILSGKDGLISVEVEDKDPVIAAQIANAYVERLGRLMSTLALTEAQQRRLFFEKQLTTVKDKLIEAETQLRASGVDPSILRNNPNATVGAIAQVQAQIAAQEVKIGSMRGYLSESSPDLRQALTELQAFRAQLSKLERGQQPADGSQGEYVSRYRQVKYYETLFELFAKQFELAKVDEAREGSTIQVLDAAVPPEKKSKPKKALIAILSTLVAACFCLMYVFLRQSLRAVSRDPEAAGKLEAIRGGLRLTRNSLRKSDG
jgi:tyrosine-protein kinase Etk/Wzc